MTTQQHHRGPAPTGCPPWTRRQDALRLLVRGVTVRAAGPVALVVGTLLSAVNQGGVLLDGDPSAAVLAKVAVNYLTPFVVASLGFLAAGRRPPGGAGEAPAPEAGFQPEPRSRLSSKTGRSLSMSAATGNAALKRGVVAGIVGGMVGAMVMAMYAMAVSATVKDVGFFTPLYHIAATFISPKAMMESMGAAAQGDALTFRGGPAVVGLVVHMMTGAMAGAMFGAAAVLLRLNRAVAVAAGGAFGLMVLVVNGFVGLPLVADLFDGGEPIETMPELVGWGTFTVEHLLYGVALGLVVAGASRVAAAQSRPVGARSAA